MSAGAGESRCPACGADAVSAGVCARCGYAEGERNRCPHCQAIARLDRKGPGVWVCAVCGGPRLPGGLGGEPAAAALADEKAARAEATKRRVTAWVWGVVATFATLAVALAWPAALVGKIIALAIALTPALLAVRSGSKVAVKAKAADEAHERALLAAAQAIAAAKPGGITAAELARRLEMPEAQADALLTRLAVHDRTRVDVGDDAEVRYSVSPGVRIETAEELPDEEEMDDGEAARKKNAR